ncbi:multifunctional oxoglutarate decarboxylase/oxoglutarate dehydrogenase thiamine pyrophosphate-binding subunit/dihydrolipoyllysine-residue succinyltransferase subunit [Janibacter cremeus]|uniref:multifunctional oxoglutarate decarboxylase/oxoglutarate dehydrogenase thiamine pyrophosphate-binding subunit/dihydrolipoyllysine-residue succinyltransferase subunit n=1 Tax=Janibacter cremeus TaxID=1285192 RepID=UPI0023F917A3|nr:multifunctional oxoglutarate decarboxylase/oxoglutarate dehydrogenase thiamine pyrophosphate-binding subunit/dihydrolipoyllysine-residue succinyltransferase subunit [Janibacter cremeus]WEV78319.1 multifunctional oxoglutarate decarboxylase/oxoglutarate dehydrogenase thiamine pyrophosphate-binding subunit/dihydrolipoyllysine-residue succinyltransferase subunit [Janibacter cremeus]
MPDPQDGSVSLNDFGPNEWLVDELYEQFKQDRNNVDEAWWEFFENYEPDEGGSGNGTTAKGAAPSSESEPAKDEPKPEQKKAEPKKAESEPKKAEAKPEPKKAESKPESKKAESKPEQKKSEPKKTEAKKAEAEVRTAEKPSPTKDDSSDDKAEVPEEERSPLRGVAARVVSNMEESIEVPVATSVRAVPAKLLIDNRIVINNHLKRSRGGKVSFTHIIGYAMVKALTRIPSMNVHYDTDEKGKPVVVEPGHIGLGIAIDLEKSDGSRQLMVPSIKRADRMNFTEFWRAYEEVVKKARGGKLTLDDFSGTTISLTNPGGIGTVHSIPRLMKGQSAIIGVGALDYPAEWQGASAETINRNAVSKLLTLTSTYDHRVIQGAQSGEFLRLMHEYLLGKDGFYDDIFASLRIPYQPVRWVQDISATHDDDINKVARVQELIHSYRVRGHLMADIDPLEYKQRHHDDLDITSHGLTLWDLERHFATGGFGGEPFLKLRKILGILRDSYCRTTGVEYMHIQDPGQRAWMQERLEVGYKKATSDEQLRILRRLNAAEAFETFLQTKFVGQKRFSLEGGESVIAVLDRIMSRSAAEGINEVCIGMPHRGRLNVLANLAGKSYGQIFREFEGKLDPKSVQGSGDVKYHLGTEGEFTGEDGSKTKVYLAANPSHLEAVNPVLEGITRAKQDRLNHAGEDFPVLPILMHGDAAFAGQGVVAETLQQSQLRGYRTGGTIHVIVNNQVGFTTAPSASRSSWYSTDVARMIQAPIFHVNGDDPEACVRVAELAFEFRQKFHKDVVIDVVCYRRRGHNEGDDPSMTQPLMYKLIENKRSVRKLYTEALIGRNDITPEEADDALRDYQAQLERVFAETKEALKNTPDSPDEPGGSDNAGLERPASQTTDDTKRSATETGVDMADLKHIAGLFASPPEDFTIHNKLQKAMEKRAASVTEGGIDWGTGEMLALGSLLMDGTPVRLTGQDTRRGTFVQRHAVLIDKVTAEEWTPLNYIGGGQARFWVYDSLLSEFAAVGFEYGYSVERPDALVLWEAQFGDFVNGAAVVIDEFISSSEQKWGQNSSVVLLLPHGYEGQGPDHSSARIERFLQMCAEENMTVAFPSTPASYFHLLRRQAYHRPRRPLVVFTPKSMLRLRAAASSPEDFTSGGFRPVLPDTKDAPTGDQVTRVLIASGKVIYDLEEERAERKDEQTAIVRLERYYPLPGEELARELAKYPKAELVVVQEEPENMGGWPFLALNLPGDLAEHGEERPLRVIARPASASPAAGTAKKHKVEQGEILREAFDR